MDIRQVFPSPWISPDDLSDKRFELTIRTVTMEEVHDRQTNQKISKMVIAFEGAKKKFITNKTQAFAIAKYLGSTNTDQWIGKRVALRAGKAHNGKPTIVVEKAAVEAPAEQLNHGDGE